MARKRKASAVAGGRQRKLPPSPAPPPEPEPDPEPEENAEYEEIIVDMAAAAADDDAPDSDDDDDYDDDGDGDCDDDELEATLLALRATVRSFPDRLFDGGDDLCADLLSAAQVLFHHAGRALPSADADGDERPELASFFPGVDAADGDGAGCAVCPHSGLEELVCGAGADPELAYGHIDLQMGPLLAVAGA